MLEMFETQRWFHSSNDANVNESVCYRTWQLVVVVVWFRSHTAVIDSGVVQ